MGKSLQDQFLKLGLVNKEQAAKANRKKHKNKKKGAKDVDIAASEKAASKKRKAEKDYNKLLNEQKAKERTKKEIRNRLEQLVERHRLKEIEGETPYKFTDDNKIRKLFTTPQVIGLLSSGKAAIVKSANGYHVVPAETAEKISTFLPDSIKAFHKPSTRKDQDDPYAEYEIPDDLTW